MYKTQRQQEPAQKPGKTPLNTAESLRREVVRLTQALEQQALLTLKAREDAELYQSKLVREITALEALVTLDGLTGLKNRRAFEEQLEIEFRRAIHYHAPISVIMLDVDRFKPYNDMFGHPGGDEVLKRVARLLQENARDGDFVARYGGEEFAIVMAVDQQNAAAAAERLRLIIERAEWPKRHITASFGVATMAGAAVHYTESNSLVIDADYALYYSKSHCRNRVTHAHDILHDESDSLYNFAINSGGDDIPRSNFLADCYFSGGMTSLLFDIPIDLSSVIRPAPEEVYQSERLGNFTCSIPGLPPHSCFNVRLHFAEFYAKSAGERIFNVFINETPVLTNWDILAECGAMRQALIMEYAAVVTGKGEIVIRFESIIELAKSSGIEIVPFRHNNHLAISCGGGSESPFVHDMFYKGGRIGGPAHPRPFDLSEITVAVPESIYNRERYGDFTYVIPNLPSRASCLVQLHFCEFYWKNLGERIFNVAINDVPVLTNFDILEKTGAMLKPAVRKFAAVADGEGKVTIDFTGIVDKAQVNGIEVFW